MAESNFKWNTFLDAHDPNLSESYKKWKRLLDVYLIASGISEKSNEQQKATILYCAGNDIILASEHFTWRKADGTAMSDAEKANPQNLLLMIEQYCNPRQSEVIMSFRFWNVPWSSPFDTFLTEIRNRAEACNFLEKDRNLRDKIVFTSKGKINQLLLREANLDLARAIEICRGYEQAESHVKEMSIPKAIEKVDRGKTGTTKGTKGKKKFGKKPEPEKSDTPNCGHCGKGHAKDRKKHCPAYGQQCHKCKKWNHFASACRTPKVQAVEQHESEGDTDEKKWLTAVRSSRDTRSYAMMKVNDCNVKFLLDPGATVNCINTRYVHRHQVKPANSNENLYMWNNSKEKCYGEVQLDVVNPKTKKTHTITFSVVDNNLQSILDVETCKGMDLITVKEENFQVAKVDSCESLGDLGEATLTVDPAVTPKTLPCRKVPISIEAEVKKAINDLVDRKILIPVDKPSKWVSQMAAARKPNGSIRICIDPQPLNKALQREHYRLPTFDDVLPKLLNAKVFSKVDVKEAYWHIKLDEKSSFLTTMITPIGRFRWSRLPFGLKVSSEIFQKRLHHALNDLEGVICVADDIIILGRGSSQKEAEQDHATNLSSLLKRCEERNILLNKAKMDIKKSEIEFLGHKLSKEGISASVQKIKAIRDMPAPEDVSGVRRFCGMIQYLARYTPNLADDLEPIHRLTHKNMQFSWSEECQKAFDKLKHKLCNSPVLAYYDPDKELVLQVDSSDKGLGAVLLQEGKPIEYASRNLRTNERGWSQLEKETLAVVFGLEKFDQYTYGRKVRIQNDHKPLESILAKPLSQATKRVQSLMMRIFRYDYEFEWIKGEKLYLADTLSRAYLEIQGDKPDPRICSIAPMEIPDKRVVEIKQATASDEQSQIVIHYIMSGWPEQKCDVVDEAKTFYDVRDTLSYENAMIYKGERVFIPASMRKLIKSKLHTSHNGAETMMRRARETVYWPGMTKEVQAMADSCKSCQEYKPANPKEPLMIHDNATKPWDKIGCDMFTIESRDYLIVTDYYSNFIEVDYMKPATSQKVIHAIEKMCARYGIPKVIVTDNGSQFTSQEFKKFTNEWKMEHRLSSPYHQQTNGKAESSVKIIKNMMRKCLREGTNMYLALLEQRSMPRQDADSPASLMFNRKIVTQLPTKPGENEIQHRKAERQITVEKYYNQHTRELPPLVPNQAITWKNGTTERSWRQGMVIKKIDQRTYLIRGEDGGVYTRNRVDLRPSSNHITMNSEIYHPETSLHLTRDNVVESNVQGETLFPAIEEPSPNKQPIQSPEKVQSSETPMSATSTPARPRRTSKLPKRFEDYQM
jgi:transposase InsO family protein